MQKFMARQPILDGKMRTCAYELLFRSGLEPFFKCDNADLASSSVVVDSFFLFGMQALTEGRPAYLNFTRQVLLQQFATLLPREQVVIEILESVKPDADVVAACKALKSKGYTIALDDFVLTDETAPLLDLTDIVKVDFLLTPAPERRSLARSLIGRGIRLLAEKVETHDQHREAVELGYSYFQGYFFSRPEIVESREVPAYKLNYLLLMEAINRSDPDFGEFEGIIKREASLAYRLLRYLNSAAFAFSREISSIRHALSLLGLNEVRKWTFLVALAGMGEDKPSELAISAIVRARMCEMLAPLVGYGEKDLDMFLVGLLSLIDAILSRPMDGILHQLAVSEAVRSALLERTGRLRDVLDLVLAVERGDWEGLSRLSAALGVGEDKVSEVFLDAVQWGNRVFSIDPAAGKP